VRGEARCRRRAAEQRAGDPTGWVIGIGKDSEAGLPGRDGSGDKAEEKTDGEDEDAEGDGLVSPIDEEEG